MYNELTARNIGINVKNILIEKFSNLIKNEDIVDAMYLDLNNVIGFANLEMQVPIISELFKIKEFASYVDSITKDNSSVLILYDRALIKVFVNDDEIYEVPVPLNLSDMMLVIYNQSIKWAGVLNNDGEHIVDMKAPRVGPHFSINLLMGNRIGFPNTLQTTPKSVVDIFGRGSFRSHADTQVLATRWDMRPEENGFPANRQFYLYEGNEKIFYSAEINKSYVLEATCKHSQNYTTINYKLECGLDIERIIFILPQKEGLPLATEVHRIKITNNSNNIRTIRIVYTGMFGSAVHHALYEDVLYSNLIMQSKIINSNIDKSIIALIPDYYPKNCREYPRFHITILHAKGNVKFPKEFCMNYNEFVGNGSLENPEYGIRLSNKFNRKGPGFFANAINVTINSGKSTCLDNLTGLIDNKEDELTKQINNLINEFSDENKFGTYLNENKEFYNRYKKYLQIKTEDKYFDAFFNNNLPYQILYQTFMSRSFCQTQKGYREIGFREIQDLFSSMNYLINCGYDSLVQDLIKEWAGNVYEMGYANHNFYWVGKEPGKWSDDPLWLVFAVYRYINISNNYEFLNETCSIAGTENKKRTIFNTLNEIIRYTSDISIGEHGFPLIDFADWNDCLKVDKKYLTGIEKEKLYRLQLVKNSQEYGVKFENNNPESIMNTFLLKLAIDNLYELCKHNNTKYANDLKIKSNKLKHDLNEYAWKVDFYSRVLFNDIDSEFEYLGAVNDGFSSNPAINGTYFLNSFSWSVLSDVASEEQIELMINKIEKYLKTDYGFKLVSEADLSKVSDNTATGHYFHGDRENGAVFKHAAMMAVSALFKSAKTVKKTDLAKKMLNLAYWMIDLTLPYTTLKDPFKTFGNPRFCTQYNNSETGENMGPMLSGTATWLNLAFIEAIGFKINGYEVCVDPLLREKVTSFVYCINLHDIILKFKIKKSIGFKRILDSKYTIIKDGKYIEGNSFTIDQNMKTNFIEIIFED